MCICQVTMLHVFEQNKSERYWPKVVGKSIKYGDIKVINSNVEEYADYVITSLKVIKEVSILLDDLQLNYILRCLHVFTSGKDKNSEALSLYLLG